MGIKDDLSEDEQVKVNISLKRAIQSTIFFMMAVAIAVVWPLKLLRPWQYVGEIDAGSDSIVQNETTIVQEFVPEMYGLSYISFYIYNEDAAEVEAGTLVFRLFDENMQKLEEKEISLAKLSIPGVCRVRIGSEMQIGAKYYFSIENKGAELLFSMQDEVSLDARYEYKTLFTKPQYALCALAVLCVGAFFLFLAEILLKKDTHQVKFDFGFRLALSILAAGISLWGMWNVFPGMKFTANPAEIVFYELGILLFLVLALYGLLHRRDTAAGIKLSREEIQSRIPGILQSVAFAGVMLGGVRYLNALSSYQQKLASNLVLACFAAAILCGYTKKELLNWYNLVYLFPAVGYAIYYCLQHKADAEYWEVYKGTAIYAVLWGIVALNAVWLLIQHRKNKVSWIYAAVLALLVAEMVRSRNTRTWPIDIAVFWGIFAIRVVCKGKVQQYLSHFSNGVFLHFIGISVYAILYRPFHNFVYVRYPGVFHTVTVTAVYLVLVLVLAVIRFLEVYKKYDSLKKAWKEFWLAGMAAAFLLMTISRTGFLAVAVICPLLLIITALLEFKDGIGGILKRTGILLAAAICFFPILFTACRIVPAVVGKPFTYEIEWFPDSIKAGEAWDSPRYITLSRFFGIADERLNSSSISGDAGAAAETDMGAAGTVMANINNYSNGRLDIYKLYLQQLNWKGHETVGLKDANGKDIMHAHNVYLQVAHDFGIGAGVFFILFCVFAGIRSIWYYLKHKGEPAGLVPLGIISVFGVCGLVEWVFIPYIPTGFAFLSVLVLLIPANQSVHSEV